MGLILLDTNILADHFNGIAAATTEIAYHSNIAISAITQLEVAVGLFGDDVTAFARLLRLLPINVVQTDDAIIQESIRIRKASIIASRAN